MKRTIHSSVLFLAALFLLTPPEVHAGTTTRIEENDPSVVYSGNWYPNTASPNSGGRSVLANALGARAAVTFTGTAISWIGVADPWSGFARVYLDGVMNIVDCYGSDTSYQRVLFTARGLAPGVHTLSIEIMHTRDVNGSGSWVWIDGFDVEEGGGMSGVISAPAGRTEQNNPSVNYTGTWFLNSNPIQSGGTAVLSTDLGSRATISFAGTGISWIAYRDQWSGIANIYIDGALKRTIDTYTPSDQARATGYSIDGLIVGAHTLTIEVTGTHSAPSQGSWVWIDAFDIVGGQ